MPNNTIDYVALIDDIESKDLKEMGECNCPACVETRKEKFYKQLREQTYPELPFLPRNLDKNKSWNGVYLNWQSGSVIKQQRSVLTILDSLKSSNRRAVGQYRRYGTEFFYCRDCGVVSNEFHHVHGNFAGEISEQVVCENCFDTRYTLCPVCDTYINILTLLDAYRGGDEGALLYSEQVCQPCYEANWTECYACHESFETEFMSDYAIGTGFILADQVPAHLNTVHICNSCANREPECCECCGTVTYRWNCESNQNHNILCQGCYEKFQVIHPWEWKPPSRYQLSSKNPKIVKDKLLYGVELEIENNGSDTSCHQMAHAILDFWEGGYLYIKDDTTINDGIEIVTHPFSWQDYREQRIKWGELFDLIKEYGYGADDWENIGMHVHMSKNAFTRLHLYKFLTFIYAKGHRTFVGAIAQRLDHDFAMFCAADQGSGIKVTAKNKHNCSDERHSAVNLTNADTVEIRIFASTILAPLFHKNMEFLQSLYIFTQNTKISHITVPHYWMYLNDRRNSNQYRHLIDFINGHEHINSAYSLFNNG